MTLHELCKKDVIQVITGTNLGRVDDLAFNRETAKIEALVLYGRPKLFGLLGRQPDVHIPWEDVTGIGMDVVMVKTQLPEAEKPRNAGVWEKLFT